MDFKTAIRVHKCDIDMDTGEKLSHSEIYGRMIEKLGGVDAVFAYVPFSTEKIKKALQSDTHLNNLPIATWDTAAIWLRNPLLRSGITCFSEAECVCTLKECARRKAMA